MEKNFKNVMTKQMEEQEERHSPELKTAPTSISAKVVVVLREDNPNSLSDPIDLDWNPIVFGGGVPVGGHAHLTLRSDGTYTFSGHFHDSGALDFKVMILWVVKDTNNVAYSFSHKGSLSGTFSFGSRDNDWADNGYNASIAQNWNAILSCRCNHASATASWDPAPLWDEIKGALGVISTVISIVASL